MRNDPFQKSTAYLSIKDFLDLHHLPARLCLWQAAVLLGMSEVHIPILVAAGLLKPLGDPPLNAPKYFARNYILRLSDDERWLGRASNAIVKHWASRNQTANTTIGE
jgi:hypothetical protein